MHVLFTQARSQRGCTPNQADSSPSCAWVAGCATRSGGTEVGQLAVDSCTSIEWGTRRPEAMADGYQQQLRLMKHQVTRRGWVLTTTASVLLAGDQQAATWKPCSA